jgi:hypothetical protein
MLAQLEGARDWRLDISIRVPDKRCSDTTKASVGGFERTGNRKYTIVWEVGFSIARKPACFL